MNINNEIKFYSFEFDYGRGYQGAGLFSATPNIISGLIGKEIHFGEISGKHSEVIVKIEEGMIKELPLGLADESLNKKDICFGLNPLDYITKYVSEVITPDLKRICIKDFSSIYRIYDSHSYIENLESMNWLEREWYDTLNYKTGIIENWWLEEIILNDDLAYTLKFTLGQLV